LFPGGLITIAVGRLPNGVGEGVAAARPATGDGVKPDRPV